MAQLTWSKSPANFGSPVKNIAAYGAAALVLVGVARFDQIRGTAISAFDTVASANYKPSALENAQNGQIGVVAAESMNGAITKIVEDRLYQYSDASAVVWVFGENGEMFETRLSDAPERGTARSNMLVVTSVDPQTSEYTQSLFSAVNGHDFSNRYAFVVDAGNVSIDRDQPTYTFTVTGTDVQRTVDSSRDAGIRHNLVPGVNSNGFAIVHAPDVVAGETRVASNNDLGNSEPRTGP